MPDAQQRERCSSEKQIQSCDFSYFSIVSFFVFIFLRFVKITSRKERDTAGGNVESSKPSWPSDVASHYIQACNYIHNFYFLFRKAGKSEMKPEQNIFMITHKIA